jgi:DNA-binding HxlR family transcriptional regulator
MFLGKSRFSEFRRSTPAPPPRLLSQRLQRLEHHGLIERAIYNERPPRAEYRLTEKGRTLFPVLREMVAWGLEHLFDDSEAELRDTVESYVASRVPEWVATRQS